jgi:hypothetical protein
MEAASITMEAMSTYTDTAEAPRESARHACPTRIVSDTASRVVQLWVEARQASRARSL